MIVMEELPFLFSKCVGFRNFMTIIQPQFNALSHTTIVRDVLNLHESEKSKLKAILNRSTQGICLTIDT